MRKREPELSEYALMFIYIAIYVAFKAVVLAFQISCLLIFCTWPRLDLEDEKDGDGAKNNLAGAKKLSGK